MIITISGSAGSGKSSVAKILAKKLKVKHYSAGNAQREIARERGISIEELGKLEAEDDSIDRMIDKKMGEICRHEKDAVVDAWLGAYFAPQSIKFFLDADTDTRVKRRLLQRRKEEKFDDFDTAKKSMLEREKINRKRWIEYYGFDYIDTKNYNYVIRTDKMTQEEIADYIIKLLKTKILGSKQARQSG